MGYHRAGFDVVGIDYKPQKRYPFRFIQADATKPPVDFRRFDVIHASPPCQAHSSLRSLNKDKQYADIIPQTRDLLIRSGKRWVMENVVGSTLQTAIVLCGSMFGLNVLRHRCFESSTFIMIPSCEHGRFNGKFPVGLGSPTNAIRKRRGEVITSKVSFVYGSCRYKGDIIDRRKAMGIDWMNNAELTQSIPPAYTEFIGKQLLAVL